MADEHIMHLQPGTVIAGRYEVVKCLGAGSMGLVYACRHRELSGHLVAIKVLFPEVAQDKTAAARFKNEIFASYGVSHPNVVRAYEFIRDGDLVAYTMEYVGGGDLADRLGRRDDPIPIADIVRYASQMCSGVQAIHDAGIVHRDLKPENILLTKDGMIKIADFGIARTGHGPKLTEHGGVVGTIDYVSPEYMMNAQVDWRSDIYALGILTYEMVTGESPFKGDSVYATMTKRLKSDPITPSSLRPECPPTLDKIIARAMHRDPELRYQSAMEMFNDLRAFMPDKVQGVSIPNEGMQNGKPYQGPSVSSPGALGTHEAQQLHAQQDMNEEPQRGGRYSWQQGSNSQPNETSGVRASPQGGFQPHMQTKESQGRGSSSSNSVRHQAGSTEINNIAMQYQDHDSDDTIHEPIKMEPILGGYSNMITDTWDQDARPAPVVKVSTGGIDSQRMRKLSQAVDQGSRSLWVDVLTLLIAIVVGIGIGFILLKTFAPQLLSRGAISGIVVTVPER